MKLAPLPTRSLAHLDMMRGVAAFAVAAFHARGLMFLDYDGLWSPGRFTKFVYLATGFGHQAVVVFFVLSGLFIGHSVLSSTTSGRWSWSRYLLNRFTRIYLVLIPALLLTLAWDSVGMHLFGSTGNIYAGLPNAPHAQMEDVRVTIGAATFLGNLAFLQTIVCLPFGSNSPLWSLSLEFWVYLLFPLLVRALGPAGPERSTLGRRGLMLAVAVGMLLLGGTTFAFFATVWGMGALVAVLSSHVRLGRLKPVFVVVGGGLFAVTALVARLGLLHNAKAEDFALGLGTATFVLSLLAGGVPAEGKHPSRVRLAYARVATVVASCSYTLYLVHFPPLAFAHAWKFQAGRWAPSAWHFAALALVTGAIVVLYAYPLSRVTEAHTGAVRSWLERRFLKRVSVVRPEAAAPQTLPRQS